jgi:hypothetical protein
LTNMATRSLIRDSRIIISNALVMAGTFASVDCACTGHVWRSAKTGGMLGGTVGSGACVVEALVVTPVTLLVPFPLRAVAASAAWGTTTAVGLSIIETNGDLVKMCEWLPVFKHAGMASTVFSTSVVTAVALLP